VYGADPAAVAKGEPERGGEGTEDADDASLPVGGVPGAFRLSADAAAASAAAAAAAAAAARPAAAPRAPVCIVVQEEHGLPW